MREIKFRAWDKNKKIMVEVARLGLTDDQISVHTPNKGYGVSYNDPIEDFEVMQYAGLKDKNGSGNDIYEGDVLELFFTGHPHYMGVVKFKDGMFFIEATKSEYPYKYVGTVGGVDAKIIGNIYENPELLEDK